MGRFQVLKLVQSEDHCMCQATIAKPRNIPTLEKYLQEDGMAISSSLSKTQPFPPVSPSVVV